MRGALTAATASRSTTADRAMQSSGESAGSSCSMEMTPSCPATCSARTTTAPGGKVVTVPDGGEMPRRARRVRREGRVEHPPQRDPLRVDRRVLAVRPADHAGQLADDADRIRALPPEMARVEVHPHVRRGVGPQGAVGLHAVDAHPGVQLEADPDIGRRRRRPVRQRAPVRPDLGLHLPGPQALVVVARRPEPEDADRPACPAAGAARHRDDAVDAEHAGELDRPAQRGLRFLPRRRIRVERVTRRVHGREGQPELAEVAGEHLALGGIRQKPIEVEVRARAPRADAHLDVRDAVLHAPRERVAAGQVLQPVGEQADPHQSSFSGVRRSAPRPPASRSGARAGPPAPPRPTPGRARRS